MESVSNRYRSLHLPELNKYIYRIDPELLEKIQLSPAAEPLQAQLRTRWLCLSLETLSRMPVIRQATASSLSFLLEQEDTHNLIPFILVSRAHGAGGERSQRSHREADQLHLPSPRVKERVLSTGCQEAMGRGGPPMPT